MQSLLGKYDLLPLCCFSDFMTSDDKITFLMSQEFNQYISICKAISIRYISKNTVFFMWGYTFRDRLYERPNCFEVMVFFISLFSKAIALEAS
jgi:hypothetical protein